MHMGTCLQVLTCVIQLKPESSYNSLGIARISFGEECCAPNSLSVAQGITGGTSATDLQSAKDPGICWTGPLRWSRLNDRFCLRANEHEGSRLR